MKIKRKLCKPCAEKWKAEGTHSIVPVYDATEKVDCFKCKRRRFGNTYIVEKKGSENNGRA